MHAFRMIYVYMARSSVVAWFVAIWNSKLMHKISGRRVYFPRKQTVGNG